MKFRISKVFLRIGNQFNVNIVQSLLNKAYSIRSLCNVTNITKPEVKPNLLLRDKINAYNSRKNHDPYTYFLLSIPIGTFMLGTWQIQRRKWKLDLIEKLSSRINHQPIELPENLQELQSMEYYPVKVKGTFLYEKEFFVGYRSLLVDGKSADYNAFFNRQTPQIGYHVITPFKLADRDLTILVNRGWIPSLYNNAVRNHENQTDNEEEIVGIVRVNEKRPPFIPDNAPEKSVWYYRDLNQMAKKADASPVYIEMIHNKNSSEFPRGSQTKVELRNEHLSYIITWYSLSLFTGYMWYKQFMKRPIAFKGKRLLYR